MNLDVKGGALLVVVIAAVAAGAYTMGVKQSGQQVKPATVATSTPVPTGHPALPNSGTATIQSRAALPTIASASQADEKFAHFRVGNRNVKSILADGDLMWIGSSGGVIRYETKTDNYKMYNNKNGLLSNGVFYVGKLQDKIAVGTYGGGLSLLDTKTEKWQNYNVPQGLADAFVYEVLEAANGDVWIATWSGANRIRGGDLNDRSKWDTYTVDNTDGGLPNDWVYGLAEDPDGSIWLGTEGGLAHFKDGKWKNWQHKDGLGAPYELVKADIKFKNDPGKASSHHARQKIEQGLDNVDIAYNPNYIISMEIDHNGIVWSGTWGGGVSSFDGQQWKSYTMKDGLPSNHIFMLREDADGQLWIGTSGGLVAFNSPNDMKKYTTANGLYSDNVFSMAEGTDGSRWVGSYGGVAHITKLQ